MIDTGSCEPLVIKMYINSAFILDLSSEHRNVKRKRTSEHNLQFEKRKRKLVGVKGEKIKHTKNSL